MMTAMTAQAANTELPTGLRQAVKTAQEHGWVFDVKHARHAGVDGVEITSFVLRARRAGVHLASRHESRNGSSMGFASGWRSPGPFGIPARLGWREVLAELKSQQ